LIFRIFVFGRDQFFPRVDSDRKERNQEVLEVARDNPWDAFGVVEVIATEIFERCPAHGPGW
jgi:hypothetical protein